MTQFSVFNGARILVTGHTGFKGSWLSLWLTQLGAQVIGVSLDPPSSPSHFIASGLSALIEDHRLDIRNASALRVLVEEEAQPDFVFHLAAQPLVRVSYASPVDTWQTNCMGTINLLEALRSVKSPCVAVFITSDKCYDNVEWLWGYRETDALGGPDPYSASKAAAELAIRSYVRSYFASDGMVRIGVGRAGNVIGGGDWAHDRIVPDCMRAWSSGETLSLRCSTSTRPWQHVLEPLSGYLALAAALKRSPSLHGEPFNFGPIDQHDHSVGDLVESMASYWNNVSWEDLSAQYGGPYESGLLKLNCDKALHHLNWRSVWSFEDTVRETAVWYRRYYDKPSQLISHISIPQIEAYVMSAASQGLAWAQ